jgi:hypothetical protein
MVIITILIILGIRAGMITTDFRWFHDVPCIGSSHSVQSLDVYSGLKSQALKENGAHWSCARGRRKSRRTTMSQALRWWYAAFPSIGIPPNHLFFFLRIFMDFPWNKPSKLGSILDGNLRFKSLDPWEMVPHQGPHRAVRNGPRGVAALKNRAAKKSHISWLMIPICLGCYGLLWVVNSPILAKSPWSPKDQVASHAVLVTQGSRTKAPIQRLGWAVVGHSMNQWPKGSSELSAHMEMRACLQVFYASFGWFEIPNFYHEQVDISNVQWWNLRLVQTTKVLPTPEISYVGPRSMSAWITFFNWWIHFDSHHIFGRGSPVNVLQRRFFIRWSQGMRWAWNMDTRGHQ